MSAAPLPAWHLSDDEPREAAFPDPPGGGLVLAILGGVTAGASILVFLFLAWVALVVLALAAILTGAAVRQARHVVTATVAAIVPPVVTAFSATCLTGYWGFLAVGIVVSAAVVAVVTPLGFGVGRLLRGAMGGRGYAAARAILAASGTLSILGWAMALASAIAPGACPAA